MATRKPFGLLATMFLAASAILFGLALAGCNVRHPPPAKCELGYAARGTYAGQHGWAHTAQWPGHDLDFYPDGARQADGWTFRVNILCCQFTPDGAK